MASESFTERLTRRAKRQPSNQFVIQGSWPKGQSKMVIRLLRPAESKTESFGAVKAVATNQDSSFVVWMGSDLGDDMVGVLGSRHQAFIWASRKGGKLQFDTKTPVPRELWW